VLGLCVVPALHTNARDTSTQLQANYAIIDPLATHRRYAVAQLPHGFFHAAQQLVSPR
jgi:hypothetical protein